VLGRWSYTAAYDHSEDKATDTFKSGWLSRSQFATAMASGLVNPFGPSGPEGDALLQAAQISGAARTAKGTMDQLDARASAEIYVLPGGPLALAIGAEGRRERLTDSPPAAQNENDVLGSTGAINPQSASRTVEALFVEFNVPIVKALEAQISARYDHYSDFGSTTNPKIALRWLPVKSLLLRGSWSTGFRAPSLPDLHTAQSSSITGGDGELKDPVRCPVTGLPSDCGLDLYAVRIGGNPALVPETSTQWTAGIVWEPAPGVSIGLDYWNIDKRNVIGSLDDGLIFEHFDVYGQSNVIRGPVDPAYPNLPGPIQTLIEYNQNVGNQQTSGIDVSLRARSPAASWGRLALQLDGTYINKWIEALNGLPAESFAGRHGPFGPVPRWRHYASLQWEYGAWRATVAQTFQSGYTDANRDVNDNPRNVGTYSVWDLQGTYSGWRNTTLTLGIKNIFDRAPPFTNQTNSFQVGYEPLYGDPRGRTFYARLTYAFK
jgi:iron complex outermembrane recepter protein